MFLHLCLPGSIGRCEYDYIRIQLESDRGDNNNYGSPIRVFITDCNHDVDEFERSDKYLENLAGERRFQNIAHRVKCLSFESMSIDSWQPLFLVLQLSGAVIEGLDLDYCVLTDEAALLLGQILTTTARAQPSNDGIGKTVTFPSSESFPIKTLKFSSFEESTYWIDGFLENKTITNLHFSEMPVLHSTIKYIQDSPQLKEAILDQLTSDEDGTEPTLNTDVDALNQDKSMSLEKLDIRFDTQEPLPSDVSKGIMCILRQAKNLKELHLTNLIGQSLSQDILKEAIHCERLELSRSDFDPQTVLSLVKGDQDSLRGKLKHLHLGRPKDQSQVELLFQLVDWSLLDTLRITYDGLIDALCHHLTENKGPKNLEIHIKGVDLNDFATRLASSLVGNDKIEKIEITTKSMGRDFGPQRKLLDTMGGNMPRLRGWSVDLSCDFNKPNNVEQWNERILHQVQSNWNIHDIFPPFELDDDIEDMLGMNALWKKLFCRQDELSSGIWSFALSQTETVNSMFRVLLEIPSIFQQVADAASRRDAHRGPNFVVPHHPNCPGCAKKQKQQERT